MLQGLKVRTILGGFLGNIFAFVWSHFVDLSGNSAPSFPLGRLICVTGDFC